MPALSEEQVSDQTIVDMHAYLAQLTKPEGFAPQDAGLPDDAPEGQKLLVAKRCVACHSTSGPINGFIRREETPTVAGVVAQLRNPRQNMPSYSVEQVSDDEAALITEFLVAQIAPPALPTAGGEPYLSMVVWILAGVSLLMLGLLWRRLAKNPQ
jgi:mono/diheme cytochrome c family protein